MTTLADRIIHFNSTVELTTVLPDNIAVMNPFKESDTAFEISSQFYKKYYDDNQVRTLILGINPGRLGAGVTGIPFTDTNRLEQFCAMDFPNLHSHELSSVFVYDLIEAYGGVQAFYDKFYINSVCPLGFTIKKEGGKIVNYNYYDSKSLQAAVEDFVIWNIKTQIDLGCSQEKCFVLGSNKNYKYLLQLNKVHSFFKDIIPLEHPRYIMQYKSKEKEHYINKFIQLLDS